jgi:hypothetical protein
MSATADTQAGRGGLRLTRVPQPRPSLSDRAEPPWLERESRLLHAISPSALERALSPTEKTALQLALRRHRREHPRDSRFPRWSRALPHPAPSSGDAVGASHASLIDCGREVGLELRRLVADDLAGMFDQETSALIDLDAHEPK